MSRGADQMQWNAEQTLSYITGFFYDLFRYGCSLRQLRLITIFSDLIYSAFYQLWVSNKCGEKESFVESTFIKISSIFPSYS